MISDREIREEEEWKAVAAALKDESDIPPASHGFTSRCLHAALRGQRPAGLRQLRERRCWLRIAAAAAALCALTAAGAAAILGSRGAALRVAADSDNTDVSPVALEAKPETRNPNPAQAFDDLMPRRSDDSTIRRFDDSTIRRFDDLTQGDTMNTTTLRTLAASAAIAAATGAPLATSASSAESGGSVMTAASNSFTLDTRPSPQTLAATIESFSTQPTAFVLSVR